MRRTWAVVATLVVTLVIGATGGPSGADPAAGAQFGAGPTTGLVDGQAILVGGTGFTPNTTLHFYECRTFSGCVALDGSAVTDSSGRFATVAHVRRGYDDSGTPVDCAVTQCFLTVSSSTSASHADWGDMVVFPSTFPDAATIPLSFSPRPSVTVVHNRRLADGQTVTIVGRDFVPGQTVYAYECTGSPCTNRVPGSGVVDRDGRVSVTTTVRRRVADWAPLGGELPVDCAAATRSCILALALRGYYEDNDEILATTGLNFARTPAIFGPGTDTWEGDSGTHPVEVRFGVTTFSHRPQVLRYRTYAWTATDADFEPAYGTVTVPGGATEVSVTVQVRGDTEPEPDEVFLVVLRGTGRLSHVEGFSPVWIQDPTGR